LLELYQVWRYLRRLRPDVCHAFLFIGYTLVLPLAWAARVPVRISGRRGFPVATGVLHRLLATAGRVASTMHLCNSQAGATATIAQEGVPTARVRVIPNAIEVPEPAADLTRQPARGVVIANLVGLKGHADLLAALAQLNDPPHMCFVGEGPAREHIADLIDRHHLGGVVTLAGSVPEAARMLPDFQFAVLPSHSEGLPNAVLEAMAAGLPAVATSVGGIPEIIVDGVTGLLVPPRSPAALAAAISRLAADPELRVRLGRAARETAAGFSLASCVTKHEAAYREMPA
jgi:glycosyltransferase involved in cell wall biosynthesis